MSSNSVNEINFELDCTTTWGVKKDKYSGFSIPVVLDDESIEKIEDIVKEHGVKDPMYGNTIYLKVSKLSEKQNSELLGKGRCHVMIHFKTRKIYEKKNVKYLIFKVTKPRKVESPESDGECAED